MNLKHKIERHGLSYKSDARFTIIRMLIVLAVLGYFMRGEMDLLVILLMILYVMVSLNLVQRRIRRNSMYFEFKEGHPTYDDLKDFGDPDEIIRKADAEIEKGKIIFGKLGKPKKTSPETIITENYFVHLNKKAYVIPLEKVVCAYIYDNVTKTTPPDKFLPTYFKPVHLIVTYGKGKEAIMLFSTLPYKKVLETLDDKLKCAIFYTRELGGLYNTDYNAFVKKVGEAKKEWQKNKALDSTEATQTVIEANPPTDNADTGNEK